MKNKLITTALILMAASAFAAGHNGRSINLQVVRQKSKCSLVIENSILNKFSQEVVSFEQAPKSGEKNVIVVNFSLVSKKVNTPACFTNAAVSIKVLNSTQDSTQEIISNCEAEKVKVDWMAMDCGPA